MNVFRLPSGLLVAKDSLLLELAIYSTFKGSAIIPQEESYRNLEDKLYVLFKHYSSCNLYITRKEFQLAASTKASALTGFAVP